jgi:hypothetical protein
MERNKRGRRLKSEMHFGQSLHTVYYSLIELLNNMMHYDLFARKILIFGL